MKTVEIETADESPLVSFALEELSRVGEIYDGMVNEAAVEIVGLFAAQGHSGGSASLTTDLVNRLMRYSPLTPLTGEDDEWVEVGSGVLQNRRCSHVFKENGRAHDIEILRPEGQTEWVEISFPYTPA